MTARTQDGWADDALCREIGTELFFAEDDAATTKDAIEVCRHCPVRVECLEYALANPDERGVWGGLNEFQRRPLLRDRRRAQAGWTEAA